MKPAYQKHKLLKHNILTLILLILGSSVSQAQTKLDSLFDSSALVFSGRVESVSGGFVHDLGTEHHHVTFQIDDVYKELIHLDQKSFELECNISSFICDETPLSKCIEKYKNGKWVFFISEKNVLRGGFLPENTILNFSEELQTRLLAKVEESKIQIDHFKKSQVCQADCNLCASIENSSWKKIEKFIKKEAYSYSDQRWMQHRRVKWSYQDRVVLTSLPSYSSTRLMLKTSEGNVEALINYQLGYYKTFMPLIPAALSSWFRWDTYSAFTKENVDTIIFLKFSPHDSSMNSIIKATKYITNIHLRDSLWTQRFGPEFVVPDDWYLLANLYEDPMQIYLGQKETAEQLTLAKRHIDSLQARKHVYSLCIMASHQVPEISMYALEAISKLQDPKSIPFLIAYAEHQLKSYTKGIRPYDLQEKHYKTLIETLDTLTGVKSVNQFWSHRAVEVRDMEFSLTLWRDRIRVEGDRK